jgi:TrpR-related protein YerC/YecD
MALYEEIVSLQDVESCYRFFQDLCSITELRSMEQRFDVAKLLDEGKVYTEIVEQTGASSATISRVNRALKYGENGLLDAFHRQDETA